LDESKTELQRILQNLDPSVGSRIASLHSRTLEQHLAEAQPHQQPNKETMTNDDDWEKEILDSLKRKRGGDCDHPERTTLGTIKNNLLRLKKIIEIHQAAQ
jgi:hypothetical protein